MDTREKVKSDAKTENVTGNDYFKEILIEGRLPEKPNELLMTSKGAIQLLKDVKVGVQRLQDQFSTGGLTSEYIFSILEDKVFIVSEFRMPRIRIVGLIDDNKVSEEAQTS